jgi:transcription factor IIIB subunit 2
MGVCWRVNLIKKRAPAFSNHINYDRLKELFPGGSPSASSSKGASPAGREPPVREVTDEDAEGEEEEAVEEDEDLENEHMMEDEDEGFGNMVDDY